MSNHYQYDKKITHSIVTNMSARVQIFPYDTSSPLDNLFQDIVYI